MPPGAVSYTHLLLPDKPGELVSVASTIAEEKGNVIKLEHNQFVSTNRNAAVEPVSYTHLDVYTREGRERECTCKGDVSTSEGV